MGFKPTETTLSTITREREVEFSYEQFITDVMADEYILVVGSEVIMDKQEEPTGDVNQYILRSINSILHTKYSDFNQLVRNQTNGQDTIRNLLFSDNFSYDLADIAPELRQLIHTKLFRFVLTTTFDSYLETLMTEVWGQKPRIVNIGDKATMDQLRNTLNQCRNGQQYTEPTLFYIFGKAERDETKKFVCTDDDAIQIIEKWIQLPKEDPMMKLIRNKKLLALGCKFDDWYFRFFWYILKRDVSRFREGQVAFLLNEDDILDCRLSGFLRQSRIYRHNNARAFMAEMTTLLTSTEANNPFRNIVLSRRRKGGIFISYSSHDVVMASKIFFMLTRQGYDVWFDNTNLHGSDNYDTEIEHAINSAQVFLPLLTPHVAADIAAGHTSNYYNDEWRMAAQTGDTAILPLAINGYDLRANYHTKGFEAITGCSVSGINLMDADGQQQLIEALDIKLR